MEVQVIQLRSNCSDGAKVGANFKQLAGEKVTITLFFGAAFELGVHPLEMMDWVYKVIVDGCWKCQKLESAAFQNLGFPIFEQCSKWIISPRVKFSLSSVQIK